MLVLTRKAGESIVIGGQIRVTVLEMQGRQIRLGIEAPSEIPVHRGEVYERIREELEAGARDLREAIREGYNKVFSTIIDANVTNLIVCFVLYRTATTEVKGFAVTLSIGSPKRTRPFASTQHGLR